LAGGFFREMNSSIVFGRFFDSKVMELSSSCAWSGVAAAATAQTPSALAKRCRAVLI